MTVLYDPSHVLPPLRVLVCGGRDFADAGQLNRILSAMHGESPFECVIHGAARGADSMAGQWARRWAVPEIVYPADWKTHGRAAGAIRNQQMLAEGKPNYVIAFAGGRGTADMLRRAKAAGVDHMQVFPLSPDRSGEAIETGNTGSTEGESRISSKIQHREATVREEGEV